MAEQWIEWGVRRTWGAVDTVARLDERTARACANEWPGDLVHRIVTASDWADGEPNPDPTDERLPERTEA